MKLKELLIENGIDKDIAEKCTNIANAEIHEEFIPKYQYDKKIIELQDLQEKNKNFNIKNEEVEELKTKLANKEEEFQNYKIDIEKKTENINKTNLIKEQLKKDGITSDKLINLLIKEVDMDSLEFENDNIKNWHDIGKSLKENYSDFYTTTQVEGVPSSTPPTTLSKNITKEDINNMSTEEINKNWESIIEILKK